MSTTFKVGTRISVLGDQLTGRLRTIAHASKQLHTQLSGVGRISGRILSGVGRAAGAVAGLGGVAGIGAIARSVLDYTKAGDEIGKFARQVGFGVEALQELQFAADRQGVPAEQFRKGLDKMSRAVGDLRLNQGALYTTLKRGSPALLKQVQEAKSNEEAFSLLITAMSQLKDPADRAALGAAAFGRAGTQMARVAEAGVDGIEALRQRARELGLVMSEEATRSAEAMVDSMTDLKGALGGVAIQITSRVLPLIKPIIDRMTAWATANRKVIGSKIAEWMQAFGEGLETAAVVAKRVWDVIGGLRGALAALYVVLSARVLVGIVQVGEALATLSAAIVANPIGAAVAAIALAAYLIIRNWEPVKAFFLRLWDGIKATFNAVVEYLTDRFGGLLKGLSEMWEGLKTMARGFLEFIAGVFTGDWGRAVEGLKAVWEGFKGYFKGLWDTLVGYVMGAVKVISDAVDKIAKPIQRVQNYLSGRGYKTDAEIDVGNQARRDVNNYARGDLLGQLAKDLGPAAQKVGGLITVALTGDTQGASVTSVEATGPVAVEASVGRRLSAAY